MVYVELDEINVRGLALVTAWEPHPRIDMDSRHGCLVTGAVSHTATTLSVLRLQGDHEPIIATPWHRMYSHARGDWVAIEDLAPGELLRTADGAIAVESVAGLAGQREPVFNLEVAGSHRYFVHGRRVLTHNTYGAAEEIAAGLEKTGAIRAALNVGNNRTVAFARVNAGGLTEEVIGISGRAGRGTRLGTARIAGNTTRRGPGRLDAEVKILDDLAGRLSPNASGTIELFVDRAVCSNCGTAILNFRQSFPNITLDVVAP